MVAVSLVRMTNFAEHLQEALGPGYELERELLGGGMSRVFMAKDLSLGRTIVVKVLPPDLAAGVNRERFRREIQLAAQLQHPHIVPLLSAGEHGELLWYTMPYIDGESLKAALERRKQFTVRDVTRILHDVVDALAYAHKRGVVHRDIKPANILTQGSHALVTDFGVAKALSAALPGTGVTTAGMAIGTPSYMAPSSWPAIRRPTIESTCTPSDSSPTSCSPESRRSRVRRRVRRWRRSLRAIRNRSTR